MSFTTDTPPTNHNSLQFHGQFTNHDGHPPDKVANAITEKLENDDDGDDGDDSDYMGDSDSELVSSEGDVSLDEENVMAAIQEATEPFA